MTLSLRYDSRRQPVLANRVVATSQPLAAQAGLDVIRRGGNAIDAALATAITLTVVEPTANGIGGDAFSMVWHEGRLHGLNASGKSPQDLTLDHCPDGQLPQLGWPAVTVPGAVSAWVELSKRFGQLPFGDLFEAAIEYARSGFPVSATAAVGWARAARRYADFPEWQRVFAPDGRTPGAGCSFRNPDQALTLQRIADSHGDDFYHGDLAHRIAEIAKRDGGVLSFQDMDEHEPLQTDTITMHVAGADVHEMPPNGQGIAALIAMGILEQMNLVDIDPDDPLILHRQIEAMKIGFEDAFRIVTDPDLVPEDMASLLSENSMLERATQIDDSQARSVMFPWSQWSSTVYLAAADDQGSAVSFIQSNYEGFGSGVVVDGTGIAMQNRASGFHTDPAHPGGLRGGVRPFHTIIPGFVTRQGAAEMAFGIMGGPMQAQGHLQFITRCLMAGQNPQEAMDAPRWRFFGDRVVELEPGFQKAIASDLESRGHQIRTAESRTVRFGGGQAIQRHADTWLGASDSRRDGQAVGF